MVRDREHEERNTRVLDFVPTITFRRLFLELVYRKKTVITIFISIIFTTLFFSYQLHPIYKSSTLIKVQSEPGGSGENSQVSSLLSRIPFFSSSGSNPVAFERAIIGSVYVLRDVIDNLGLDIIARPKYFPVFGKFIFNSKVDGLKKSYFGLSEYAWGGQKITVKKLIVPADFVNQKLELVYKGGNNYELYSSSGEPLLTGKVGVVVSKGGFVIQVKEIKANPNNQFVIIKKNIGSVMQSIGDNLIIDDPGASGDGSLRGRGTGMLEVGYESSSSEKTIALLRELIKSAYDGGARLMSEQARQTLGFIDNQIPLVLSSLKRSEGRLASYQAKTGNVDMEQQFMYLLREVSTRETTLEKMKLDMTGLLQKYTSTHPYVITLRKKIDEMQKSINAVKDKLHTLPVTDKESTEIMRDVRAKNTIYMTLLARQQEAKIVEAGVNSNIKILSPVEEPALLVKPKRGAIFGVGIMLSILFPIIYLLMRILFNKKQYDPSFIEQRFGYDVKVSIPCFDQACKSNKNNMNDNILSRWNLDSPTVEALRSLRTSVGLDLSTNNYSVLSVVGLTQGVGKSFVASNIAYLLSELGKKVLLIDGDMRRGRQHEMFSIKNEFGLVDYLEGHKGLGDIIKHSLYGVDILPRGRATLKNSDLLSNKLYSDLIDTVKKTYDIVIVDTAPLLSLVDGSIVSSKGDSTLVVLGVGAHTNGEIQTGVNLLERNGSKLFGFVMNSNNKKMKTLYERQGDGYYGYCFSDKYNYKPE